MKTNFDKAAKKSEQKTGESFFLVVLIVMSMMLIICRVAAAQNEAGQTDENAQAQPKNLNDYFRGKYKFHPVGDVRSTVRPTPHGPKGELSLMGVEIKFENVQTAPGEHGRARAIARAFLEEETAVLGITDMNEIRELKLNTKEYNSTHIMYGRFINDLEIKGLRINIEVKSNETIGWVNAKLMQLSPEAYEATTKKTLPESRIREIALRDLNSSGGDEWKISEIKKYVIDVPPYVIWKVKSSWNYRIDAFTGEILRKTTTLIGPY
jgi:uncharacterized membrane protein YkoI